jgi:flagellar protein FliJ
MTPPFRFALERVLGYRRQQEEQSRMRLAAAQQRYRSQVQLVHHLEERIRSHAADYLAAKSMTQGELWLWMGYQERLQLERKTELARLHSLAQQLGECRRVVQERTQQRKILEKLRINRYLEHQTRAEAKEQQQFDEMATLRFSRQDL